MNQEQLDLANDALLTLCKMQKPSKAEEELAKLKAGIVVESEQTKRFKKILRVIQITFIALVLWCGITNAVYSFKYPEKTQTQLTLHFFKTILLDFAE